MKIKRTPSLVSFTILLTSFFSSAPAFAELPKSYTTYHIALSPQAFREKVDSIIEKGIEDVNFIIRPFARRILRKEGIRLISWIKLKNSGNSTTIQFEGLKALTYKNGETIKAKTATGVDMISTLKFDESTISINNVAERGTKTVRLVFSKDCSRMNVEYRIKKNDKLPQDISVTIPYKRSGAATTCND